jgi:hypothetical protein
MEGKLNVWGVLFTMDDTALMQESLHRAIYGIAGLCIN